MLLPLLLFPKCFSTINKWIATKTSCKFNFQWFLPFLKWNLFPVHHYPFYFPYIVLRLSMKWMKKTNQILHLSIISWNIYILQVLKVLRQSAYWANKFSLFHTSIYQLMRSWCKMYACFAGALNLNVCKIKAWSCNPIIVHKSC